MRRFLFKFFVFSLPLLVLISVYLITDPFKVIYYYKTYYESGKPMYVETNRNYVSFETFKDNHNHYKYDSYILGNSRSRAYKVDDWSRHINSKNCFHFDANLETLAGVEKKLQYLQRQGAQIKNALIIVDNNLLSQVSNYHSILYVEHPELSGQNKVAFHLEFLKAYLDPHFIKAYLDFKLSNKVKDYMKTNYIIDDVPVTYNHANNELRVDTFENMIRSNAKEFYASRTYFLDKRDTHEQVSQTVIEEPQLRLLLQMKAILDRQQTNYRIVISPGYDQVKLNPLDLHELNKIFGAQNVFDFSGKNSITANMYNYYELFHYRPHVATQIMDSIYKQQAETDRSKNYYTKNN